MTGILFSGILYGHLSKIAADSDGWSITAIKYHFFFFKIDQLQRHFHSANPLVYIIWQKKFKACNFSWIFQWSSTAGPVYACPAIYILHRLRHPGNHIRYLRIILYLYSLQNSLYDWFVFFLCDLDIQNVLSVIGLSVYICYLVSKFKIYHT